MARKSLGAVLPSWGQDHPESKVSLKVPLADQVTFKVGGLAKALVEVGNEADLEDLLALVRKNNWRYFLLGGGSNVLFDDKGFDGLVIRLGGQFTISQIQGATLNVGAGAKTPAIVKLAQDNGLTGLEHLFGLPGTIGGAVFGNAGSQKGAICQVLTGLRIMEPDGLFSDLTEEDFEFGYRRLKLKAPKPIIVSAQLSLAKDSVTSIVKRSQEIAYIRKKQPKGPNAGCIFKNPVFEGRQISAGFLIEMTGLKGFALGGAMISPEHANFIVNVNKASSLDIILLMEEMRRKVFDRFGLELEPEIRLPSWRD
ncbi:MAG: UDP-N-acetylmuramate dehydrogenase [Deltaproteobacteria bacterium]|jgi:UDP-N-acetylmuramate dehydrogenase|nr:UDP-N-acetylmuramate dehydrogenase [Deltaproteobacteria bacterium]